MYETIFVRKQDSSRKRKTSWLTLLSICAQWALQYIKYKQYLRFFQNISLTNTLYTIPNAVVLRKKSNLLHANISFTTTTILKKWLTKFYMTKLNYLSLTNNSNNLTLLKDTNIVSQIYENQEVISSKKLHLLQSTTLNILNTRLVDWTLSHIVSMYKILILLTLSTYDVK